MGRIETNFKQTEVGLIPVDWEDSTFKEICWVNQGLQIPISNRFALPNKDSKLYITIQYLNDGKEAEYIDDYNDSVCCNKEDILMTRTGNTGIVVSDVEGVFHNNFFKINFDRKKIDKDFLTYYLKQPKTKKIILAQAGVSTIPDLNHRDFYSIPIPLPPTKTEQTLIANALSDADGYIESLEKLIDKKQKIKQGSLQQLLKPKENWEVKKLGEVCKFQNGTALESYFNKEDGYKVISIGNYSEKGIFNETGNFIAKNRYENVKKFILEKGDLAFLMNDKTAIGTIIGRALFIEESDKYIFNQRTMRLVAVHKFMNPKFLFHLINSNHYHALFVKLAKPGTQIYLNTRDVLDFEIMIPALEEQLEIAQILSDIDNEITILNQKLTKAKAIKQGMMQQLLTGKIRLI